MSADERAAEALAVAWHAYAFSFPPGKMPSTPFTGFTAGWHARDEAHAQAVQLARADERAKVVREIGLIGGSYYHNEHDVASATTAANIAALVGQGGSEPYDSWILKLEAAHQAGVAALAEPGGFARARGALPFDPSEPTPEATIRRLRGDDDADVSLG